MPTSEEEFHVQLQQPSELRQHESSLVPIARLPSELLSDAFIRVRDGCITTSDQVVSSTGIDQSWIAVSLVSHYWRQTALATPQLWVCIQLRSGEAAHESIQRSRALPLRIFMSDSHALLSAQLLEAARASHERISSLSLQGKDVEVMLCLPLVVFSADNLCVLELGCFRHRCYEVPDELLNVSFPRLHTLKLVFCVFNQNCAVSLIHLDTFEAQDIFQYIFPKLSKTLETLQFLEDLTIMSLLDLADRGWIADHIPELNLPSLKSLYVRDRLSACAILSHRLRIPHACRTEMCAFSNAALSDSLAEGLFALISSQTPATLHFTLVGTDFVIHAFSSTPPFDHKLTLAHAHWRKDHKVLTEIGTQLSARAPCICLGLEMPIRRDEISISALRTLCGNSESIATYFRVEGSGAPATLAILAECIADHSGFLPRLEHMSFRKFDMGAAAAGDIEKLAEALIERKRAAASLGVSFKGCDRVPQQLKDDLEKELDWVR